MATIPLGVFMWKRIQQVGCDTIMGLPGDFNLNFLDYIYDVPGLQWAGNANELNAAYAADGYARAKGVPGCVVTTHGVGELSALNGIAGAACEHVKVIHVVGQTARVLQENHMMIHHSIGMKPDHQVYNRTSKEIRFAAAECWDVKSAPAQIDAVIRECIIKSGPVYINMPIDLSAEPVDAKLLDTPIDLSFPVDHAAEQQALDAVMNTLSKASNPALFLDVLTQRFGCESEAEALADTLNVPTYVSGMARGLISETHPRFVGIFNGDSSWPGIKSAIVSSDAILELGNLPADTNTAFFSRGTTPAQTISINRDTVKVRDHTYEKVFMKPFLQKLIVALKTAKINHPAMPSLPPRPVLSTIQTSKITQAWAWPHLMSYFKPRDAVFGDTGTCLFGMADGDLPADARWHSQNYFGSIGWATPAAVGAVMAYRDIAAKTGEKARGVNLVTGDGALQLTIQEIGTLIARNLSCTIFVINNNGYTIERIIHGAKQKYNDITPYNYAHVLPLFGATEEQSKNNYRRVSTRDELDAIVSDSKFAAQHGVKIIEVMMDTFDTPWRLVRTLSMRGEEQVQKMREGGFIREGEDTLMLNGHL